MARRVRRMRAEPWKATSMITNGDYIKFVLGTQCDGISQDANTTHERQSLG